MVVGPHDKRAKRKRCQTCAQRRVKCEGRFPCNYCTQRDLPCAAQDSASLQLVLVHQNLPKSHRSILNSHSPLSSPSSSQVDPLIHYFFSSFLLNNNFGVDLDHHTIYAQLQTSHSLNNAVIAVAAIDRASARATEDTKFVALRSYRNSVLAFRQELQSNHQTAAAKGSWTTFFLGLFELMYDISGEGWVRHILYGTSRIIQSLGPTAFNNSDARSFFLTFRVFEVSRSLIYSEPSFLCSNPWSTKSKQIWAGHSRVMWRPKEEMLDLMLDCSDLNQQVINVVDQGLNDGSTKTSLAHQTLSMRGNALRDALESWWAEAQSRQEDNPPVDPARILAIIYYHATSIYLSGIFDYRCQLHGFKGPHLPQGVIDTHVDRILVDTQHALVNTRLSGILFFFPLRVAGARASSLCQRESILTMLQSIKGRNFIVADAFAADLSNLWAQTDIAS